MKKNLLIMISSLLCVLCISCRYYVHNVYDYDDDVCIEQVSYKQGLQDVEGICSLIKTSYAGYNNLKTDGFNEKTILKNYKSQFRGRKIIQCQELYNFLYENLSNFIHDTHFTLNYDNDYQAVVNKVKPFYSNTYVKKEIEKSVVLESDVFDKGSILIIENDNLFPAIKDSEACYRVGVLSDSIEQVQTIDVLSGDTKIQINCNSCTNSFREDYFSVETGNSLYLNVAPFFDHNIQDDDFFSKLLEGVEKNNLIIDVRNNRGGDEYVVNKALYTICYKNTNYENPDYKEFISYLDNGPKSKTILSKYTRDWFKTLRDYYDEGSIEYSEITKILSCKSKFYTSNETNKTTKIENGYKGHIYLLTSKTTASSSETLIASISKLFPKTQYTIIGTNTAGALRYGNVFNYCLNNSGISVSLGCTDFSEDGLPEEGKGYIPDYWCDDNDIYEVLQYLTKEQSSI